MRKTPNLVSFTVNRVFLTSDAAFYGDFATFAVLFDFCFGVSVGPAQNTAYIFSKNSKKQHYIAII